ncbi:MAG: AAA family ATPase [Ignavibacteria bacterium]|nr:AAA family ATPase [Ignavibacteria bacterium]
MKFQGLSLTEVANYKILELKNPEHQDRQDRQKSNTAKVGDVEYSDYGAVQDLVSAVNWAWFGWIPNGLLTMLAAEAGKGKSYLALWIAKIFIHGGTFPDGTPHAPEPNGKIL